MAKKVDCQQYSKSMQLLGLRLQLREMDSEGKDSKEIRERILALEKELGLS